MFAVREARRHLETKERYGRFVLQFEDARTSAGSFFRAVQLGGSGYERHVQLFRSELLAPDVAQEQFGHMLEAFTYGAPPHGGIAFGWDRTVMMLAGAAGIAEVIAFPKTQSGTDPLTGAPSPVDDLQLAELGMRRLEPPKKDA